MKRNNLTFILFIIIGVLFVGLPMASFGPKIGMKPTRATITNLLANSTVVSYVVDGTTYEESIPVNSSSYRVGKEIKIYYDPANPSDIRDGSMLIVFIAFGSSFVIVGAIFIANNIVNKKRRKDLLHKGNVVAAAYIGCEATNISVNNRQGMRVLCTYNGKIYKSPIIYFDPSLYIQERNIEYFNVYLDPSNDNRYYLDIEEIIKIFN